MTRVLVIGDAPYVHTEESHILFKLNQTFLAEGFDIRQIGWGSKESGQQLPFQIYPGTMLTDKKAVGLFSTIADDWKPHIVFSLGQIGQLRLLPQVPQRHRFKWIGYFNPEAYPLSKGWAPELHNVDRCLVSSRFGLDIINKILPGKKVGLIYPGISEVYRPENKAKLKEKHGLRGKFVVGWVGRNRLASNLGLLLQAFAAFSLGKTDVVLYLGFRMSDEAVSNISEMLEYYGLEEKVIIVEQLPWQPEAMNEVYNLFDLMVKPSMGEGLGLSLLEAQACGIPLLVTDCSVCRELVQGEDELIAVNNYFTDISNLAWALGDPADLINKLEGFYNGKYLYRKYAKTGRLFCHSFAWQGFVSKILQVIRAVEEEIHANHLEVQLPRFHRI